MKNCIIRKKDVKICKAKDAGRKFVFCIYRKHEQKYYSLEDGKAYTYVELPELYDWSELSDKTKRLMLEGKHVKLFKYTTLNVLLKIQEKDAEWKHQEEVKRAQKAVEDKLKAKIQAEKNKKAEHARAAKQLINQKKSEKKSKEIFSQFEKEE
ncbi:MAG: hypothetical protein KBT30_02040 [Clostridiales bacterium]|nr:hypothetical protein [Candidatus Apopatousia equi]